MKVEDDGLVFSDGGRLYAKCGIIGLAEDMILTHGYDGGFNEEELTPERKREIADYMIDLWSKYKASI